MRAMRNDGSRLGTRGSARVTVMVVMAVLLVLLAAFVRLIGAAHSEQTQSRDGLQVLYVAEAGLGEAYLALEQELPIPPSSADAPLEFANVNYWVDHENLGMRVHALRATAVERTARERIEL